MVFFGLIVLYGRLVYSAGQVNMAQQDQTIDGFGCSSAWLGKLSQKAISTLFGTGANQLGMSILRVRIDPNKQWSDELSNAKGAEALGAKGNKRISQNIHNSLICKSPIVIFLLFIQPKTQKRPFLSVKKDRNEKFPDTQSAKNASADAKIDKPNIRSTRINWCHTSLGPKNLILLNRAQMYYSYRNQENFFVKLENVKKPLRYWN